MAKDCSEHAPTPAAKPNEFADLRTKVDNAAYNLEHHQNNSGQPCTFQSILDEVYRKDFSGKSEGYKQAFGEYLDRKLEADGQKSAVIDEFASENFDFLSNGKKRIQTADLNGKATELGLMGRTIEQRLTEDLMDNQGKIEKAHHEGKFLGIFGHKHGIDQKRLDKDAKNEYDANASEDVLRHVATPQDWDKLTGGTAYHPGTETMTQPQLEVTVANAQNPNARTPYVYTDQVQPLNYIDDHFNKMSTIVPTYYGGTERVATLDSMTKYARKHHVDWTTVIRRDDAQDRYDRDISTVNPADYKFD